MAGNVVCWVQIQRGNVHEAAEASAAMLPRAREAEDPQMLWTTLGIAGLVALGQGDEMKAVRLMEELAEEAGRESPGPYREYNRLDCIRLNIELGRVDLARSLLERSGTRTTRQQHAQAAGRALLAEATGDPQEALGLYVDAVRRWADFGNVPERGHALLGQGRCLLVMGRGTEAHTALQEAAGIFADLRAKPFVERADRLLRDADGVTPSARP